MVRVLVTDITAYLDGETFALACAAVDSARLAKIRRAKTAHEKARSLGCGLLLQYAVRTAPQSRAVACDAREDGGAAGRSEAKMELRYGYGANGKPYLLDDPAFFFSLSHSGNYAAIAVSDRETGIDLQQRRPVRETLARRVLSADEYRRYERTDKAAAREDWFFRCWCAKESFGKLTGNGLLYDFRRIGLAEDGGGIRVQGRAGTDGTMIEVPCREYVPAEGYYMNVCTERTKESGMPDFPRRAADVTREVLGLVTEMPRPHIIS